MRILKDHKVMEIANVVCLLNLCFLPRLQKLFQEHYFLTLRSEICGTLEAAPRGSVQACG